MNIPIIMKALRQSLLVILTVAVTFANAQDPNPTELLKKMEATMGGWDLLWSQNDVEFQYDYVSGDGQADLSIERYIFEGEHSWAKYTQHDINAMPGREGEVIQALVNNKAACTLAGKAMTDEQVVGGTDFLRRANYFWFTMFFKLNNPGTIHKYLGSETMDGKNYHKISVAFEGDKTGKEQNDEYILFLNAETMLVDQFFFSLPAMGVNAPVLKMAVEYEEINGLKLPTKRYVYQPGADGKPQPEPFLTQTSSNVKFNNGFKPEDFKI